MPRIVVTGMGIVSALGIGCQATLEALRKGQSRVRPLRHFESHHSHYPCGEVAETDDELRAQLKHPHAPVLTRTTLLGAVALQEAMEQAGLPYEGRMHCRMALVNGTTVGGMEKTEQYYKEILETGKHAEYVGLHDCGACTTAMAQPYGFDYCTTLSTACSSAANAVIHGADLLLDGQADVAVVGGSECISKFHLNGFHTLMILDSEPCRPFSADRAGLNLGEGAAYLVLETEDHAQARGAKVMAYLSGYGNACDAFHPTASSPHCEGGILAMRQAIDMAGLEPKDIDYINAHGTGTPNNDETEGLAIMDLFGDDIPPVSSTKAYTGHTTSASGTIESVICLLAMQHHFLPANLHWHGPIEALSFTPNTEHKEDITLHHVLCNAFAFGGNDSSLLFSDPDHPCQPQSRSEYRDVYLRAEFCLEEESPQYSKYIPPLKARRMGKLHKRAIYTAMETLAKAGIEKPDAIIIGTCLGSVENTERFLTSMIDEDEQCLQPTYFMQSTHNTIATTIALHLNCHGYNSTYSQQQLSFASAINDAKIQLRLGRVKHVLVGVFDEMTPNYRRLLEQAGLWRDNDNHEIARCWLLSTEPNPDDSRTHSK